MQNEEKTTAEKRKETLERNRAFKEKARAERGREEQADKERAKAAMRAILDDATATPQQKLDALEILDSLTYSSLIPYSLKERRREAAPVDMESFKAEYQKRLAEQAGSGED